MDTRTVSATDLRDCIGEVIQQAIAGTCYTKVTYHNSEMVAIVPIHGIYGWAITEALAKAEKIEKELKGSGE